jgi:hypothetical protein
MIADHDLRVIKPARHSSAAALLPLFLASGQ